MNTSHVGREHTYRDFQYGILHSIDYRCSDGHLIHEFFETIYYDDITWC